MSDIEQRLRRLSERLDRLQRADVYREVFGAATHDYALEDPATEDDLAAFEKEHGVELPTEYRLWISKVGRGGPGPFYGLASFGDRDHEFADDWQAASPGRPFPLAADWLPETPKPWGDGASPYDGCLYLSHQGCGYFDFLVVVGDRAGQVWSDYTAGDGSITLASDSFFDWLENWIDDAFCEWAACALPVITGHPEFTNHPGVDEAVPLIKARAADNPGSAGLGQLLGYIHIYGRDWDAAFEAFEQMKENLDDEPEARHHHCRSHVFRAKGDLKAQESELRSVLQCDNVWFRTEQDARDELKGLCFETDRDAEAYALIAEIAEASLDDLNTQHEHAWALYMQNRGDDAVKVLRTAVDSGVGSDPEADREERVTAVFDPFVNGLAEGGDEAMAVFFRDARSAVLAK